MLRLFLLLLLCDTIKCRWKKILNGDNKKAKDHNIIYLGSEITEVFIS